ncbi:MAG: hypothetical protein QOI55_1115 [Actinomycetota bacterium]|nr:hypothetical protein [Actinomycetota bacterium]
MLGVILVLVALFVVGPMALFLAGAIWSALLGWLLTDDADRRAGTAAADA